MTSEERFWGQLPSTSAMQKRLCFLHIIDVVAVGPFASGLNTHGEASEDHYVDSNDAALLPLPLGGSQPRTAFFKVLPVCRDTWLELPCYRVRAGDHDVHALPQGKVRDVIQVWAQDWPLRECSASIVHRLWAPLAAAVLRSQWKVLGAVPPLLNSWAKFRQGALWVELFGHIAELQTKRRKRRQDWMDLKQITTPFPSNKLLNSRLTSSRKQGLGRFSLLVPVPPHPQDSQNHRFQQHASGKNHVTWDMDAANKRPVSFQTSPPKESQHCDPQLDVAKTEVPHSVQQWQLFQDELRLWAQRLLHCPMPDTDDWHLSPAYLEFRVSWVDKYVDALLCPVDTTTEKARGREGRQYEASMLVKFLLLSKEICNDRELTYVQSASSLAHHNATVVASGL